MGLVVSVTDSYNIRQSTGNYEMYDKHLKLLTCSIFQCVLDQLADFRRSGPGRARRFPWCVGSNSQDWRRSLPQCSARGYRIDASRTWTRRFGSFWARPYSGCWPWNSQFVIVYLSSKEEHSNYLSRNSYSEFWTVARSSSAMMETWTFQSFINMNLPDLIY